MLFPMLEIKILGGVLITSIISGILGMGGGIILMALYNYLLPVKIAFILHGITQFSSNSSRAFLLKKSIQWKIVMPYLLGSLISFFFLRLLGFSTNKNIAFIGLGVFPFVAFLPRISSLLSIDKKGRSVICGVLVTIAQIMAGASGSVLDIFYLNSNLNRYQIVASKALTQTLGHLIKLFYYFILIKNFEELTILPYYIYFLVVITAYIGTYIGKIILKSFSENYFRAISQKVIFTIALFLLFQGLRNLFFSP